MTRLPTDHAVIVELVDGRVHAHIESPCGPISVALSALEEDYARAALTEASASAQRRADEIDLDEEAAEEACERRRVYQESRLDREADR